MGGGDQDGRVEDLSSPPHHEHIKNTSRHGAILTENKLEIGRNTLLQPRL